VEGQDVNMSSPPMVYMVGVVLDSGLVWIIVHIISGPGIMLRTNMISPSLSSISDGSCGIY